MKKTNKKGFTIVELVIVIAVVAILAAVLIPTFVSVVNKANESSDISLVKNINTVLATEEIDGKNTTVREALADAAKGGYTVEKLTPRSNGDILWNEKTNRFVLINEKGTVVTGDRAGAEDRNLWKIVRTADEALNNKYSGCLDEDSEVSALTVKGNFDSGNKTVDITFKTTDSVSANITTNGGTLTVEAASATVNHFGKITSVDIKAVYSESYHEHGEVGYVRVEKGHFVAESGSKIITVYAAENTAKIDNNSGTIENAYKANGVTPIEGNQSLTELVEGQTEDTIKDAALYQYNAAVKIGNMYYSTLSEALEKVESKFGNGYLASGNAVFTLQRDLQDDGIVVAQGSNITIDFNGFTYDIDGTVGSVGTPTNGFQLLKDSTVVLKNGTLTSVRANILIQNYSNLTLDNMVISAEHARGPQCGTYAVSNNNGVVNINNTTIIARADMYAFDVCRYSSYKSVYVRVTGNSVISGKIEISATSSKAEDGFGLTLENGNFSKATIIIDNSVSSLIETNFIKKGSNVEISVSSGYEWVAAEDGYQKLAKKN